MFNSCTETPPDGKQGKKCARKYMSHQRTHDDDDDLKDLKKKKDIKIEN